MTLSLTKALGLLDAYGLTARLGGVVKAEALDSAARWWEITAKTTVPTIERKFVIDTAHNGYITEMTGAFADLASPEQKMAKNIELNRKWPNILN